MPRRTRGAMEAIRVLIVEDELLIALDAELTLEDAGYEVTGIASSEDEAVEMALDTRPDLMVVDLRLAGGTSGHRVAERVREVFDVALVFASGNLDPETRDRLRPLHPLAMLSKPYAGADLIRAIAKSA